jgi:hypothetical protein
LIDFEPDPRLIADYAQAMLDGAEFPPIVVFEAIENGKRFYHIGDGYHRADAAALAEDAPATGLSRARRRGWQSRARRGGGAGSGDPRRNVRQDYSGDRVVLSDSARLETGSIPLGAALRSGTM